jgi:hypothetical protein
MTSANHALVRFFDSSRYRPEACVNVHNAVPRRPARATAALCDDGVEDVAALALIEHHATAQDPSAPAG